MWGGGGGNIGGFSQNLGGGGGHMGPGGGRMGRGADGWDDGHDEHDAHDALLVSVKESSQQPAHPLAHAERVLPSPFCPDRGLGGRNHA